MATPSPTVTSAPVDLSCVPTFCDAIRAIITSRKFRKEHFKRHGLFLSEAYCLLWNHSGSGNMDRMKLSQQLQIGAYAAALLDLVAAGKIELHPVQNYLSVDESHTDYLVVKVIDKNPTYSFLDRVAFNAICQQADEGPPQSLQEWLASAGVSLCVNYALKNLVSRGILGDVHTACFGMFQTFPTLNVVPLQQLERGLKSISLKEARPDSYMLSLLTLSRTSENYFSFVDPVLEKSFTKKEYRVAKENIRVIVESQGAMMRSPKFTRKKFSVDRMPTKLTK